MLLSSRIIVSQNSFISSNFLNTTDKVWNGIRQIRFITNFFGGYHAVITWDDSKAKNGIYSRVIPISLFANKKILARAIVEAAYKANPKLLLNEYTLEMSGGYPPYGIFKTR